MRDYEMPQHQEPDSGLNLEEEKMFLSREAASENETPEKGVRYENIGDLVASVREKRCRQLRIWGMRMTQKSKINSGRRVDFLVPEPADDADAYFDAIIYKAKDRELQLNVYCTEAQPGEQRRPPDYWFSINQENVSDYQIELL